MKSINWKIQTSKNFRTQQMAKDWAAERKEFYANAGEVVKITIDRVSPAGQEWIAKLWLKVEQ